MRLNGRAGCYAKRTDLYAWEPLERWRYFSRQAGAILNLAARLHADQPGRPEDWQQVITRKDRPVPWWKPSAVRSERIMLGDVVSTQWITLGNVRPVLTWRSTNPGPQVEFGSGGSSFFGALACQLMFTIARVDGVAVCSGCGTVYIPPRRPRRDQRRYCSTCRATRCPATGRPTRPAATTASRLARVRRAESVVAPRASSAHTHDRPLML